MEKLMLAACGADCSECGKYKVTMDQDLQAAALIFAYAVKKSKLTIAANALVFHAGTT